MKAPRGKQRQFAIPTTVAANLVYYRSEYGPGVLGPRGWHCFGTYGSSGSSLYISSKPINSKHIFDDKWALAGPAMQFSVSDGGTSGRFAVAEAIARVFPAHLAFAQHVVAEGIEPAADFAAGPYPRDKLAYRSKEIVEYETPANQEGLGTDTRLAKEDSQVQGVLVLKTRDDVALYHLAIRLPARLFKLPSLIIQQVERDYR